MRVPSSTPGDPIGYPSPHRHCAAVAVPLQDCLFDIVHAHDWMCVPGLLQVRLSGIHWLGRALA